MSRRKETPLPAPCPECRPYDGNWRLETTRDPVTGAEIEGLERCDCARGRALKHAWWRHHAKAVIFDRRTAAAGDRQ